MNISNLLRAALFAPGPGGRWGLPMILWGEPGTGKTSVIESLAALLALTYYRLSPAERGEGQFGVVPVPGADGLLHYPAPAWSQQLTGGGLLFLDEINTAAPALQAPLLGLVQLRVLGEHTFGPRVRIIGAANETQDSAGGWDLAPALANRFGHLDFEGLDASDWAVSFLAGFGTTDAQPLDALKEEERVLAAWPGAEAKARGLLAGFVQRKPDMLHKRPTQAHASASRAWPSRRSIEYAATAYASAMVQGLTDPETDALMTAFVGDGFMGEFATWRAHADLPNPEDVLDEKVKWAHDPLRLDRTLAVLGACAALVAPDKAPKRAARSTVAWRLLSAVLDDAPDAAIPAARVLLKAKALSPEKNVTNTILHRMLPMLDAAGIGKKAA